MAKIVKVNYFTKERRGKINPDNQEKYNKYLRSNIIKNKDVKEMCIRDRMISLRLIF